MGTHDSASRRLANSEAVQQRAVKSRTYELIMVKIGDPGRLVTIPAAELCKLKVDERYQRWEIRSLVNTIIHVLLNGGTVPALPVIAERPNGDWYIVDGQQRYWAYYQCKLPMRVMLYKIPDWTTEAELFHVLNTNVDIRPEVTVKGWVGPAGDLIRGLNKPDSPYYNHINFGQSSSAVYSATILAKALLAVVTGAARGEIKQAMGRADTALNSAEARARAVMFFKLFALVFQPNGARVKYLPAVALARVAYRRWEHGSPSLPEPRVYTGISKINWTAKAPTFAHQFLDLLEKAIERKWPAKGGA